MSLQERAKEKYPIYDEPYYANYDAYLKYKLIAEAKREAYIAGATDAERRFTLEEMISTYNDVTSNCMCEWCSKNRIDYFKTKFGIDLTQKENKK